MCTINMQSANEDLMEALNIPRDFCQLLVEDGVDKNGCLSLRDSDGKVYRQLKNPAIAYDADGFITLRFGEAEEVQKYIDNAARELRKMNTELCNAMADNLTLLVLPKNQQLLDKLFNNTGYLELYINRCKQLQEAGYQWENKQKDTEETQ